MQGEIAEVQDRTASPRQGCESDTAQSRTPAPTLLAAALTSSHCSPRAFYVPALVFSSF